MMKDCNVDRAVYSAALFQIGLFLCLTRIRLDIFLSKRDITFSQTPFHKTLLVQIH